MILGLLLNKGELCVCDIEVALGISQSKASRHLRYLRNVGLTDDRRTGVWVHYRITDTPTAAVAEVLTAIADIARRAVTEAVVERLDEWMRDQAAGATTCADIRLMMNEKK
jgi:ArsR family transcriptional regulator